MNPALIMFYIMQTSAFEVEAVVTFQRTLQSQYSD
jgi:hypothetical protein